MDKIHAAYLAEYIKCGEKFYVRGIGLSAFNFIALTQNPYIITKNLTLFMTADYACSERIIFNKGFSLPYQNVKIHNFLITKQKGLFFDNFVIGRSLTCK